VPVVTARLAVAAKVGWSLRAAQLVIKVLMLQDQLQRPLPLRPEHFDLHQQR